jgi:genome maintenance exonuclease 1
MFNYCPPRDLEDLKSKTFPDGKRYYTTPDGDRLPSVTTVIGAKGKEAILKWRKSVGEEKANMISRQASSRGTNLHTICENYLNNDPKYLLKVMPDALQMFKSIKPLLNRIDNIHYQEQALWSKTIGMAGRVDCIGEFDGKLSVIDFKTSKRIKKREDIDNYFAQCVAYAIMYEELIGTPVDQIVIIMAVENEEPLLFIENTKDHLDTLLDYIEFYKKNG